MDNFETLLKEKGYTKTAFSEKLGIKKQNLNGLIKNPTLDTLKRIATALDVPMWQLFASPQEIMPPTPSGSVITCPKCGEKIVVETQVKVKE